MAVNVQDPDSHTWYSIQNAISNLFLDAGTDNFNLKSNPVDLTNTGTGDNALWQFAGDLIDGATLYSLRPQAYGDGSGASVCLSIPTCDTDLCTTPPVLEVCSGESMVWEIELNDSGILLTSNDSYLTQPTGNKTLSFQDDIDSNARWFLSAVSTIDDGRYSTFPPGLPSAVAGSSVPLTASSAPLPTLPSLSSAGAASSTTAAASSTATATYGLSSINSAPAVTGSQTLTAATTSAASVSSSSPSFKNAASLPRMNVSLGWSLCVVVTSLLQLCQ